MCLISIVKSNADSRRSSLRFGVLGDSAISKVILALALGILNLIFMLGSKSTGATTIWPTALNRGSTVRPIMMSEPRIGGSSAYLTGIAKLMPTRRAHRQWTEQSRRAAAVELSCLVKQFQPFAATRPVGHYRTAVTATHDVALRS